MHRVHHLIKKARRLPRWYSELPRRIRYSFWGLVLLTSPLTVPTIVEHTPSGSVRTANFYFLPFTQSVSPGQSFPLELRLKTNGTPINAQGFRLIFNPSYLEVVSMTTEKSFCTFYLDNTFDNLKGDVRVSCGTPQPGFLGDSLAVRVIFRAKIPGSTNLRLDPEKSQLLANDGKGSNISKDNPQLTLSIKPL